MKLVDQYSDPTFATLIPLLKDNPKVTEIIKTANIDHSEHDSLPSDAFAWPSKRLLPIHTREHTALSRVYREKMAAVPVEVDDALKTACDIFELDDNLFTNTKTAAAPPSDDYLLPDIRKLPVRTAEDVKIAEHKLIQEYTKLSVQNRALACGRLVEKAAKFNIKLKPTTMKLAGFTVSSTDTLRRWLEARVEATKVAAVKKAFQKLSDGLNSYPTELTDRNELVKLASTVHILDEAGGLTKHYDRKLLDPLMTVFNTEKVASPGVDLNGQFVPMQRIASMDANFYKEALGDDSIVNEASDGMGGIDPQKMATIINTLPRDMKSALAVQFGFKR